MSKYVKVEYLKEIADKVYMREARNAPTFEHEVLNRAVYDVLLTILDAAPAENVTPIKPGRWERVHKYDEDSAVCCSACGERFDYIDGVCYLVSGSELPKYCPNCGAKMENGFTH